VPDLHSRKTSPWYEKPPTRPARQVRRRDKVELAIALLLLTSLLGLLALSMSHDGPARARPAAGAGTTVDHGDAE
jgi:hypothetical protein